MGMSSFELSISMLCICIYVQHTDGVIQPQHSSRNMAVVEHGPSHVIVNDVINSSWLSTTEKTLIRVTRLNANSQKKKIDIRSRRQVIEAIQTAGFIISVAKAIKNTESENDDYEKIGEEILGMAKTVAIVVIVISSLCMICCLVTTAVICAKCCCGKKKRKRNRAPSTIQVPQPIFVHTGQSGYQPQFYQQQVPQTWSPAMIQPPESRPMLPQPSAPPQPNDHFHIEHPPPSYEKLYNGR